MQLGSPGDGFSWILDDSNRYKATEKENWSHTTDSGSQKYTPTIRNRLSEHSASNEFSSGDFILINLIAPSVTTKMMQRHHGPYHVQWVYTNGTLGVRMNDNTVDRYNLKASPRHRTKIQKWLDPSLLGVVLRIDIQIMTCDWSNQCSKTII